MIRMTRGSGVSSGIALVLLLLLGLRCLAEAEHVCETELRDAVAIRNLTLSFAKLTPSVKF